MIWTSERPDDPVIPSIEGNISLSWRQENIPRQQWHRYGIEGSLHICWNYWWIFNTHQTGLLWYSLVSIVHTVYPKKYAHGFVVLCFVVVMQSFIMNSHEVFIHIHQGCFAGTGAIVRLPQCQWSKPDGYGKISQCITTTKHSKNRVHISWDILYWPDGLFSS